jgi:hypothetical protein
MTESGHQRVDSTVITRTSAASARSSSDGKMGWKMVPVYGYGYRLERVDLN